MAGQGRRRAIHERRRAAAAGMIAIREAEERDGETVTALWQACELTRPWNDPHADFARALTFAGSTILIAEIDGEPVGTAMTGFDGHRGWVYYLGVAPARADMAEDCPERFDREFWRYAWR